MTGDRRWHQVCCRTLAIGTEPTRAAATHGHSLPTPRARQSRGRRSGTRSRTSASSLTSSRTASSWPASSRPTPCTRKRWPGRRRGGSARSVSTDVEGEPRSSPQARPRAPKNPKNPKNHRHRPSRVPRFPQAVAPPQAPQAEFWLYLRGVGTARELVCKVFDCYRGWRNGDPPSPSALRADAVGGSGLQIVDELEAASGPPSDEGQAQPLGPARQGRMVRGARSRWPMPGWWTQRACTSTRFPPMSRPRGPASTSVRARRARELQVMLDGRGFTSGWCVTTSRTVTSPFCRSAGA